MFNVFICSEASGRPADMFEVHIMFLLQKTGVRFLVLIKIYVIGGLILEKLSRSVGLMRLSIRKLKQLKTS